MLFPEWLHKFYSRCHAHFAVVAIAFHAGKVDMDHWHGVKDRFGRDRVDDPVVYLGSKLDELCVADAVRPGKAVVDEFAHGAKISSALKGTMGLLLE
jgi:hypothetical protein